MGEEITCEERLNVLDEQVRAYLAKAFKAQHSTKQTDCMIGYLRDMLLKVSWRCASYTCIGLKRLECAQYYSLQFKRLSDQNCAARSLDHPNILFSLHLAESEICCKIKTY